MTPHRVAADSGVTLSFSLPFFFFSSFVPGKYHCPVLYNVFSNNTHIVANKVTGNVFSYEVGEVVWCKAPTGALHHHTKLGPVQS